MKGVMHGGEYTIYDSSTAGIATDDCLKRVQRASAGLLYRFLAKTNRLAQ